MIADVTALAQVVAANPTDATARLVLADAVQEAGDETTAAAHRREAAALELRAKIVAAGYPAHRVFTRWTAAATKGHEARQAERFLTASRSVLVVIFGEDAITKSGLNKAGKDSPILYYRKSSGGRWGRSVQRFRVSL